MKILKVNATGFKNCADDFELSFVPIARKTAEDKEYELEEIADGLFVFSTIGVVGKNASGKTSVLDLLSVCYDILGKYRIDKKTFSLDNVSLRIFFYHDEHIFRYSTTLRESIRGGGVYFENQELRQLDASGDVEALFYPMENDSTYNKLVNANSADLTIKMKPKQESLRRLFLACAGHDAILTGESPVTGICRQV